MRMRGGSGVWLSRAGTTTAVLLSLGVTACVIRSGSDPSALAMAESPNGISVNVDWRASSSSIFVGERAELLAVLDTGAYLLHDRIVVFYPVGVDARLRPYRAPGVPVLDLRSPTPGSLLDFSAYARYPFGLDETVLERLMETLGQDSLVARRAP